MKFSYNSDPRELSFGLTRLTFSDNFESFVVEDVVIPAGEEKQIAYQLPESKIAKHYISLGQTGNGLVTKSSTAWTSRYAYLENHGAEAVTITIVILGAI
jgi:hypothetical protein